MIYPRSPIRQLLDDIAWPDSTFKKASASMPAEDWDALFLAVQTRLKNCANIPLGKAPERSSEPVLLATQATVNDCVHALETLHSTLRQSRSGYW